LRYTQEQTTVDGADDEPSDADGVDDRVDEPSVAADAPEDPLLPPSPSPSSTVMMPMMSSQMISTISSHMVGSGVPMTTQVLENPNVIRLGCQAQHAASAVQLSSSFLSAQATVAHVSVSMGTGTETAGRSGRSG
jgi:hypothetical protein